ncbi:Ycf66 family protein [Geminocystis sp. GBBB08]|uniref:Ycf66 family protein n=1 Tax=Geminocystis sp. GBBB08 TaxID=2604140 RepID=UPI0027E29094|nr:Ycf66 family protein [Geminocystis sp. GBBB08]MBL1209373.1 hypothetical protein [Geminocystis sp. GBBB08]
MLAYFLATFMAIISLILYLNAFISPKIHRQDDFLWSGLGLFYALTLWVCAGRITGAVLLGQSAIIAVAIAFIWENRQLRKTITAESESPQVLEGFSLLNFIAISLGKLSQLTEKKPVTGKVKVDKPGKNKEKIDVVEKRKVTDSEESVSAEGKTASVNVIEEIITDIEASEKVENIIEEIVNETVTDDSLQEDNIIEEIINQETKKEENINNHLVDLPLDKTKTEENTFDDDFDADSLGLEKSKLPLENKPSLPFKANIFSKIWGFFRKPSPPTTSQPEELISVPQTAENSILEEDTPEIDPKTTATEVEDAIANLPESNQISEDSQKISETSPENITPETEKTIVTSVEIVTSEIVIITDTVLESDNPDENTDLLTDLESDNPDENTDLLTDLESDNPDENTDLLTDLESDNPDENTDLLTDLESDNPDENTDLLTDLESDNPDENTDLLSKNTDLSSEINSQNIPSEDIIETLADLTIETKENITVDLESPLKKDNENPIDEFESLFEDEVKNKQNQ